MLHNGVRYRAFVEHASGTADNPMSDAVLEAKFIANAGPVIGYDRAGRVRDLVRGLEAVADIKELIQLCA